MTQTTTPAVGAGRAIADLLRLCDRPSRELDREFGAAQPGPTPEGRTVGVAIAWSGTWVSRPLAWLVRAVFWKGKNFDRARGRLVNRISPFGLRAITAEVSNGNSLFDGQPCIVIDYSKTSFFASMVRDEIRQIDSRIYLGLVFCWGLRVLKFALLTEAEAADQKTAGTNQ